MVENKLFLSLAHQKTAEVLEKTFICTCCVEGFKESQGLTESVLHRNFIIFDIFSQQKLWIIFGRIMGATYFTKMSLKFRLVKD